MTSPVQCELLEVVEVAGDVLERVVGDARAPAEVEAAQARQVLGQQLHALVRHLAAPAQREHR